MRLRWRKKAARGLLCSPLRYTTEATSLVCGNCGRHRVRRENIEGSNGWKVPVRLYCMVCGCQTYFVD